MTAFGILCSKNTRTARISPAMKQRHLYTSRLLAWVVANSNHSVTRGSLDAYSNTTASGGLFVINDVLQMLGRKATDRVTGFEGVISSVSFDLYGCVQALMTPPVREGKPGEQFWFDIKRLELGDSVMSAPHVASRLGEENGPADKPMPHRV